MKKTLLLALALTSVTLAGCSEETIDADTTIVEPTTEPMVEPMMEEDSTTMMGGDVMTGDSTMESGPVTEGETMPADTAATPTM